MVSKKQLYESSQVYQQQIAQLQGELAAIKGYADFIAPSNRVNSMVVNSCSYDIALLAADEVQCTNRYITEIPELNLPSQKFEDILYRWGSICLFNDVNDGMRPKIASYSKTGSLNGLGDLSEIIPIDFSGKSHKTHYTVVYNDILTKMPCVIINDFTGTYREEQIIPRKAINAVSIQDQATVYRQLKNSVMLTAKKAIALINDEGQREVVEKTIEGVFRNDSPVVSLIGKNLNEVVKMFNLDTSLDIEGYMRAIENYERLRANFNGIPTRSPIEKKERLIQAEAQSDNALTQVYLMDGLVNRQIQLELAKKHSIIKSYTCKINPLLDPMSNKMDESENDKKKEGDKNDGTDDRK